MELKGRGCSWGTLRIPFGKIGEPWGTLGESPPGTLKNPTKMLLKRKEQLSNFLLKGPYFYKNMINSPSSLFVFLNFYTVESQ